MKYAPRLPLGWGVLRIDRWNLFNSMEPFNENKKPILQQNGGPVLNNIVTHY